MNLLKNPDMKKELLPHLLLTLLLTVIGLWIALAAGALALISGLLFMVLHLWQAFHRYQAMEELSRKIDRILHGQDEILITRSQEGELAILQSEIEKMTIRLREQTDFLQKEKVNLSNAIADISHQLRTPLTSLNLTASMLTRENISDADRLRLARDLKKSLQRIDWLIEALLKISRIDAGTVQFRQESCSVSNLITKASSPLLLSMELKEQQLIVQCQNESFTGDPEWSSEALGNILKNCMEHTPVGGTIRITAAETPIYTEILTEDSGPGFSPEDLPHLFERFYKGKTSSSQSIGIGLALSRMILSAQNGTLRASNRPEGGARFTIRFYKSVI